MSNRFNHAWPYPFAIAHRGASLRAPENTLIALEKAKALGADCVECDVQLTRDGQPVILHDATLNRTTNGNGFLSQKKWDNIKLLDAGSWFSNHYKNERIPTLAEWLLCAANLNISLNLEIKARTKKQSLLLAESVILHLKKYWPNNLTLPLISSSNLLCLMEISTREKKYPLGFIVEKRLSEKMILNCANKNIVSVHQPAHFFTKEYVKKLHENHLRALAYTVNNLHLAEKLKTMDVDGIFTDNEALFKVR